MGIKLNVATFNVLVDTLSKERKLGEASNLLAGMVRKGSKPNVVTYT